MFSRDEIRLTVYIAIILALIGFIVACSEIREQRRIAYMNFLASDAHVKIGGEPLVLPFVVLPDYKSLGQYFAFDRSKAEEAFKAHRDAFRVRAANAETAPDLNRLRVRPPHF